MLFTQSPPMVLRSKQGKNFIYGCLALLISLIFSITSFWIGRAENPSHQSCDPFRLIRDNLPTPIPTISNLIKQIKP